MLVSLTVGKVDAGVTVLLTQDKRLIEFPSILLPPNIASGSIVDIAVSRNQAAEQAAEAAFANLQTRILDTFGAAAPAAPVLRCRNATQTSVVLEWEPVRLATADLLGLALYRNGQKAGNIPRPLQMHSTKISGLAVDTAYTFHLVLRTSAGTLASERVSVRTHKMTDLSGITISTGLLPTTARQRLASAVERIGARLVPEPGVVRIDTTHFVTTEGRGLAWEKAVELNIPVVRPEWVEACEGAGRILGVTKFYLDAVRPPGEYGDEMTRPASHPTTHVSHHVPTASVSQMGSTTTTAATTAATTPAATAAASAAASTAASTVTKELPPPPPESPSEKEADQKDKKDKEDKEDSGNSGNSGNVSPLSPGGPMSPPPAPLETKQMTLRPSSSEGKEEAADEDDKESGSEGSGQHEKPAGDSGNKPSNLKPTASGDVNSFQDVAL